MYICVRAEEPNMKVTKNCELCSESFEQTLRQGRPYRFCDKCRKLMWYEKRKVKVARARKESK